MKMPMEGVVQRPGMREREEDGEDSPLSKKKGSDEPIRRAIDLHGNVRKWGVIHRLATKLDSLLCKVDCRIAPTCEL